MNKISLFLFIIFISPILVPSAAANTDWLIYGKVTWGTSSEAPNIKLRLLKNNNEIAVTYTNSNGKYGFYKVSGQPKEYMLEIYSNGKLIKTINQGKINLPRGSRYNIQL